MWATIFLVIHALSWLFVQTPFFGLGSLVEVKMPYTLMAHLPFRINPAWPHPAYKNRTILGRRAGCNPLFRHLGIFGALKQNGSLPLQSAERPLNPLFAKWAKSRRTPVGKQIYEYKQDAKDYQDTSKDYITLGFRTHSICMLMPQQGNQEGACWGAPHINICLRRYPVLMYQKLISDANKTNNAAAVAKNKRGLAWAKKGIQSDYGGKADTHANFSCGYPDFCKLLSLNSEIRKIGTLGRLVGYFYLVGIIPLILTLFDPPPAVPHRLERWSHMIARTYPWLVAILFTSASIVCCLWMRFQYVLLDREVNTEALRKAYPYVDEDNPGFQFDLRAAGFSPVMYCLIPITGNAIVYWILIFSGVKYPRFPSRILERRRKFEEGYAKLKDKIQHMNQ